MNIARQGEPAWYLISYDIFGKFSEQEGGVAVLSHWVGPDTIKVLLLPFYHM